MPLKSYIEEDTFLQNNIYIEQKYHMVLGFNSFKMHDPILKYDDNSNAFCHANHTALCINKFMYLTSKSTLPLFKCQIEVQYITEAVLAIICLNKHRL